MLFKEVNIQQVKTPTNKDHKKSVKIHIWNEGIKPEPPITRGSSVKTKNLFKFF